MDVVQAKLGDVFVLVLSFVDHWWRGGQVAKPDEVELHRRGVRIRILFYCYRQMLCLLVFDLGNGRVDDAGLVTVLADVVRVLESALAQQLQLKLLYDLLSALDFIAAAGQTPLDMPHVVLPIEIVHVLLYHFINFELRFCLRHAMSPTDSACPIGQVSTCRLDRIVLRHCLALDVAKAGVVVERLSQRRVAHHVELVAGRLRTLCNKVPRSIDLAPKRLLERWFSIASQMLLLFLKHFAQRGKLPLVPLTSRGTHKALIR